MPPPTAHPSRLGSVCNHHGQFRAEFCSLELGEAVLIWATCVRILADDRHTVLPNGKLKRVAVKCMRELEQFETEVSMRNGLDEQYVMGALRVHVPSDLSLIHI